MADLNKMGGQFARFFVVGIAATLVHLVVYIALNHLFGLSEENKLALTITYSIGYIVSFIGNYILSLKWTFRTEGSVKKSLGFAFSHAVNYGMHIGLLNLFLYLGVGGLMVRCLQAVVPWLVEMFPILGHGEDIVPFAVYVIVVPVNFLLVRFFLTHGDEKKA